MLLNLLAPGFSPVASPVAYSRPRDLAMALLVLALVTLYLVSRFLSRRTRRPAVILGPAIYLGILHAVALFGLATSVRFENGLAQLTLFTFPFSMSLYQETSLPGFATGHELFANYLRYILHFGSWNALILAVFLAVAVPPRVRSRSVPASAQAAALPPGNAAPLTGARHPLT